jgi:hypothetical protein
MFTDTRTDTRKAIPTVFPAGEDREWSCAPALMACAG